MWIERGIAQTEESMGVGREKKIKKVRKIDKRKQGNREKRER